MPDDGQEYLCVWYSYNECVVDRAGNGNTNERRARQKQKQGAHRSRWGRWTAGDMERPYPSTSVHPLSRSRSRSRSSSPPGAGVGYRDDPGPSSSPRSQTPDSAPPTQTHTPPDSARSTHTSSCVHLRAHSRRTPRARRIARVGAVRVAARARCGGVPARAARCAGGLRRCCAGSVPMLAAAVGERQPIHPALDAHRPQAVNPSARCRSILPLDRSGEER
jgi:hypothetical protein